MLPQPVIRNKVSDFLDATTPLNIVHTPPQQSWDTQGKDFRFMVDGFAYYTDFDTEDDNHKLNHYCFKNGKEVTMSLRFYDHSPYNTMPARLFRKHLLERLTHHD